MKTKVTRLHTIMPQRAQPRMPKPKLRAPEWYYEMLRERQNDRALGEMFRNTEGREKQ